MRDATGHCAIGGVIAVDDPRAVDVGRLLGAHLALMHETTPPEDVHALDVEQLAGPRVSLYSFRDQGEVLAVGALLALSGTDEEGDGEGSHGELKSMHTLAAARGRGIGEAMVCYLLDVACGRGWSRVSLETGTGAEFEPAIRLYTRCGFVPCEPFGTYISSPNSYFMTIELTSI